MKMKDFQKRWESKYLDELDPGLFEGEQLRIPRKRLRRNLIYIRACNYTLQFPRGTER
jgi:hypothetical protein